MFSKMQSAQAVRLHDVSAFVSINGLPRTWAAQVQGFQLLLLSVDWHLVTAFQLAHLVFPCYCFQENLSYSRFIMPPCAQCGTDPAAASFKCTQCPDGVVHVFSVCDRDCQKEFWKTHKKTHTTAKNKRPASTTSSGATRQQQATNSSPLFSDMLDNAQYWTKQLDQKEQPEWLVDCYRMRLDDDYAWGGGNLHGLYDAHDCETEEERTAMIVTDFLCFLKLGVRHKAIPNNFDFRTTLLTHAVQLLPYAFEKSDAKEKWGGENVFSMFTGGRPSLRAVGEQIVGKGVMCGAEQKPGTVSWDSMEQELVRKLGSELEMMETADEKLFVDVGGKALWLEFVEAFDG
ncbi:unnamed protein product [Amoebophrya sp. A120]|nr:unnamed protein product [Amoebophrya sp. A120]|eukprot:GSA120T00017773001.1